MSTAVTLEYMDKIAIITNDNQKKLNALTQEQYFQLATHQPTLAQNFVAYYLNITQAFYTHPKILVTALIGPAMIFNVRKGEDANIRTLVLQEVEDRLGGHLIGDSMTKIKALIRKLKFEAIDAQGIGQAFAGLERFQAGIPQKEFAKIASGVKKHKL
ncbi:ClpP/crotonase [Diplocarpon rosae]|nr:ClpP/crotonase [Diplocarpon rosae]